MVDNTKFVTLPEEEFIKECLDIIEKAREQGIVMRILGAVAVYIHSRHSKEAFKIYRNTNRLGTNKPIFSDLDLIAYGKQNRQVKKFFEEELGFKPDFIVNNLFGYKRLLYYHPEGHYHVDIFFNKLEFNHDVEFGSKPGHGRLELDYPTVTLADLVLEKCQIHEINFKDIVDLIILFIAHNVGSLQEKEIIDGKYIAKVLSEDWGFWYDATKNLKLVKEYALKFLSEKKLEKDCFDKVTLRVDKLLKMVDEEPKSKKWQKRAKIGTSKPWYRSVEELLR